MPARGVPGSGDGGTSSVGSDSGSTHGGAPAAAASSAAEKAPAVGHRSAGVLARQRRSTAVRAGATSAAVGSGTGSCTCFIRIATGVVPV